MGVSCKGAVSVAATVLRASLLVAVAVAAVALAGCGGIKEKDVTKAQYEQQLQQIGDDLFKAANNLGQSTATGIFNANVQKLQDTIHDSEIGRASCRERE